MELRAACSPLWRTIVEKRMIRRNVWQKSTVKESISEDTETKQRKKEGVQRIPREQRKGQYCLQLKETPTVAKRERKVACGETQDFRSDKIGKRKTKEAWRTGIDKDSKVGFARGV